MKKLKEIKPGDEGVFEFSGARFKAKIIGIIKDGKLRIQSLKDGSIIDNVTKTAWRKQNAEK